MALINCPECSAEVSDQAVACPRCAHPFRTAAPTPVPKAGRSKAARNLAAIALLGGVATLAYMWAPSGSKDSVNRVLSRTGVTITPWIDRAEAAMRAMLEKPDQQDVLARAILAKTHQTGAEPRLARWSVTKDAQTLVTVVEVAWKGGFLGGAYTTTVEWRCNKQGHIAARVASDNAPVPPGPEDLKKLEEYFRTGVWPPLYSNTGGD